MSEAWTAEVRGRALLRALATFARGRHGTSDVLAYVGVWPDRGYATDNVAAARCRWPRAEGVPEGGVLVYADDLLRAVRRPRDMGDAPVAMASLAPGAVLVDGMRCRSRPTGGLPTEGLDAYLDGFAPAPAESVDLSPRAVRRVMRGISRAGSEGARVTLSGPGHLVRVTPREPGVAIEAVVMPLRGEADGRG